MKYQIEDTVIQFNDIFNFKVNLPCAHNLWDLYNEVELLDYVKADFFNH